MSKIQAKVPHEGAWQAIDIYVFSNGQQYSPPRKYHLEAQELNWWDNTINHLARTHYGSLHSVIELYTLDGTKIDGPLGLKDGTPYVAVVPPDSFIDSGYDKYLVKASRSWEKRQAKRTGLNKTSEEKLQDDIKAVTEKDTSQTKTIPGESIAPPQINTSCVNWSTNSTDLTIIKTPDDNIAQESMLVKPRRNIVKLEPQLTRRSIIATSPRFDRRRSSLQQHTASLKPNSSPAQSKNNSILKTKDTLYRRNLTKIPIKINVPAKTKMEKVTKTSYKRTTAEPQLPRIISPIQSSLSTPPPTPINTVKTVFSNNKRFVIDNLPISNIIVDKGMIVVPPESRLYHDHDNDIKSMKLESYHPPMVNETVSCDIVGVNQETQTQIDIRTDEMNTYNQDLYFNRSKIKLIPVAVYQESNSVSCNIPVDDDCIAIINKGNLINMNLHIEFQNGKTGCPNQRSEHTNIHKVSSIMNVLKRKSQGCSAEATLAQAKSLQSTISSVNDTFAKMVIVQCGCCGNNVTIPRIDTMPVFKDDNGFFVLMPSLKPQENPSCTCSGNNDNKLNDKNTKTELCIEDLCQPTPDAVYPCVTQQVGMVMTIIDSTGSQTDKYQTCDLCMKTKQVLCINEDKCNIENCRKPCDTLSPVLEQLEKLQYVPSNNTVQNIASGRAESYTQTEWCKILMEVRRHEEGRYSFHLPPLSVLRECSR